MTGESLATGVLVVGTGLLGTSVGLALRRADIDVQLIDQDADAMIEACKLGAGRRYEPGPPVALAVVAVPPAVTAAAVASVLDVAEYATDVASVKVAPAEQVRALAAEPGRFVGGHPMAGREVSGPGAALVDLFEGRPWVLCPDEDTDPQAVTRALDVARLAGAVPVTMSAADHDAAVALVSHAPHLVAALVAGRLAVAADHEVRLAGAGVGDVTRIAAADPTLWADILAANAGAVAGVLRRLQVDLGRALAALEQESSALRHDQLSGLLQSGVAGRDRLPGKHGAPATSYSTVAVVVDDRPGQLAALFADAGKAGVNVEDVRIEHSPGQQVGVVELDVRQGAETLLATALQTAGWSVHSFPSPSP